MEFPLVALVLRVDFVNGWSFENDKAKFPTLFE